MSEEATVYCEKSTTEFQEENLNNAVYDGDQPCFIDTDDPAEQDLPEFITVKTCREVFNAQPYETTRDIFARFEAETRAKYKTMGE